jgi:chorismate mutase
MKADLDDLRKRIDLLDESLVKLLNARAACALEIGRVKRELGMKVYQPEREAEVLKNVQAANHGPLDQPAMKRLFERIIDEARHLERIADEISHSPAPRSAESQGAPPGEVK